MFQSCRRGRSISRFGPWQLIAKSARPPPPPHPTTTHACTAIKGAMHPRSCFTEPPDFLELSQTYESLAPFVQEGRVDFNDPEALRAVTACLFRHYFDLDVALSPGRLCPTLPNRLNYIKWLEDLVAETNTKDTKVTGADVGTGSTAVYAMLAVQQNKTWDMIATESDPVSFKMAADNISRNALTDHITLLKADESKGILLQHDQIVKEPLTFTMCNPPFYNNAQEIADASALKGCQYRTSCTGAPCEMITDGGEVAFTLRVFEESMKLQCQIQWYTTMLGKLSSVGAVVERIRSANLCNYVLHELVQGKTRRWVLGWSFGPRRAMPATACSDAPALKQWAPRSLSSKFTHGQPWHALEAFCDKHSIAWRWETSMGSMLLEIKQDTWSRRGRRGKAQAHETVQLEVLARLTEHEDELELVLRSAPDHLLFESLCGKLKRVLRDVVTDKAA